MVMGNKKGKGSSSADGSNAGTGLGLDVANECGQTEPADNPADNGDGMNIHGQVGQEAGEPVLDERIRAQLGRQLTTYYSSLVKEPVPDKIVELLKTLSAKERGQ